MSGLVLEPTPFYQKFHTKYQVDFFHGRDDSRQGVPILAKRHIIHGLPYTSITCFVNKAISEGLAQARVDHSHSCKIREIRLDYDEHSKAFSVYHILEALDKNFVEEIHERQGRNRCFSELELSTFLANISDAISNAHSK